MFSIQYSVFSVKDSNSTTAFCFTSSRSPSLPRFTRSLLPLSLSPLRLFASRPLGLSFYPPSSFSPLPSTSPPSLRNAWSEYQRHLFSTQPQECHERLGEALERLMLGIQRNIEPSNRDKFTQKITFFRRDVRKFMTKDSQ